MLTLINTSPVRFQGKEDKKPRRTLYPNLKQPESNDFFQKLNISEKYSKQLKAEKDLGNLLTDASIETRAEQYITISPEKVSAITPLELPSQTSSAAALVNNQVKPTAAPLVLSEILDNQAKVSGINLSAADQRKMESLEQSARVNLIQTGLYTTASVVLGVTAAHFAAVPAVVSACAIGLVTSVTRLVDLTTQLVTNPRVVSAFKGILNGIKSFFGFGSKNNNGVQFAGKDKELQKEKMTIGTYCKTLFNNLTSLLSQFEKETIQEKRQLKVMEMQREIIATSAAYINSNGTEEEKRKTAAAQQFLKLYEEYVNTVPLQAKIYAEVPSACQNKLKQMIYVSLTSNVPYLTEWGRIQATQVGMGTEAIERAIQSGNNK